MRIDRYFVDVSGKPVSGFQVDGAEMDAGAWKQRQGSFPVRKAAIDLSGDECLGFLVNKRKPEQIGEKTDNRPDEDKHHDENSCHPSSFLSTTHHSNPQSGLKR